MSETGQPFALIVEDSPETAFVIERAFKTVGFRTQVIYKGDEAKQALQTLVPDVAVLDIHLPFVSGIELLAILRENPTTADAIILVASANPIALEQIRNDADIALVKPIMYSQLRTIAQEIYDQLTAE